MICEPCFWYVDITLPEEDQIISACCIECQKISNLKAWYWPGDEVGYGDYDLNCSFCNKILHKREDEAQTTI